MCIAILNKANITLDKQTLRNCWDRNKDGGGLMYAAEGKLHIYKSMTKKPFIKHYLKVREENPLADIVLHFRWSTHGKENLDNTHPHIVNSDVAMVHNGVIDNVVDLHRKDVTQWDAKEMKMVTKRKFSSDHSDTALFAKMLKELPEDFIKNEVLMKLIANYIEDDNKLIFMNRSGESAIVNEDAGIWEGGCWFSNLGFLSDKELKELEDKEDAEEKAKEEEDRKRLPASRQYSAWDGVDSDDWSINKDFKKEDKFIKPTQKCCTRKFIDEDEFYKDLDSLSDEDKEFMNQADADDTVCDYCVAPTYSTWEKMNSTCRDCFNYYNEEAAVINQYHND